MSLDRCTWFGRAVNVIDDDWKLQGGRMEMFITGQPASSIGEVREFLHWVKFSFKGDVLGIRTSKLNDAGAEAVAETLSGNDLIQKLILSTNQVGEEGARHLATMLKTNVVLRELNLWNNRIGDGGAAHLARALEENTALTYLNLMNNRLAEEGAKALADALKQNETLEVLDLSLNPLGDIGAVALANALASPDAALQRLLLWECNIGEVGAKTWGATFPQNRSLVELHFGVNEVGPTGAMSLAAGLRNNTTLHILHLNNCALEETGLEFIASCLQEDNKSLHELHLDGNVEGESEALGIIRSCMKHNYTGRVAPPVYPPLV